MPNAGSLDAHCNRYLCVNRKRCFLALVIVNFLLAGVYYLHEPTEKTGSPANVAHRHADRDWSLDESTKITTLLKAILETDYNQEDLTAFYELVQREFSLGLRCTRAAAPATNNAVNTSHLLRNRTLLR